MRTNGVSQNLHTTISREDQIRDTALGYLRSGKKLTAPSAEEKRRIRQLFTQSFPPVEPVVVSAGLTGMRIDAIAVDHTLFLRFGGGEWKKAGPVL
jgi:hypothetical protein